MALSINAFKSATAYPCGNKKDCQDFLKEVPELSEVNMYSVRDALKEVTKPTFKTKGKVSAR